MVSTAGGCAHPLGYTNALRVRKMRAVFEVEEEVYE
jgi:hypothetical protein